jgi:hypothetical protein
MMILHSILSARHCDYASSPRLNLLVDATVENERSEFPFVYDPDDSEGLSPAVNAWFADHPDFEIAPYAEPEISLPDAIAAKLVELDDYRWQMEVGGAAFGGGMIRTDWNSQNKIAAAYIMAINDPGYTIPVWEVVPGTFMALDNATIRALGITVRDHVQATFNRKAALHPVIAGLGSVEAVEAFDIAAEW